MTLEESLNEAIAAKARTIEVVAGRMPAAQLAIRDAGGWVHRMDVDRVTYTLHIYWDEEKQKELI